MSDEGLVLPVRAKARLGEALSSAHHVEGHLQVVRVGEWRPKSTRPSWNADPRLSGEGEVQGGRWPASSGPRSRERLGTLPLRPATRRGRTGQAEEPRRKVPICPSFIENSSLRDLLRNRGRISAARGWQPAVRRGHEARGSLLIGEADGLPDGQMAGPRRTARVQQDHLRGVPARAPEAVRVRMLGGFSVSVGSRVIEESEWRLKRAAGLVKLLALAPGHSMHRERVEDLLWKEPGARRVDGKLRYAIHVARRVMEPTPVGTSSRYLSLRGGRLALCPEGELWVDVEGFEEAVAAARRSRELAAYEAAIDLYAGDLLPQDLYEQWAEDRRAQLRSEYLELLLELAALCEERGEHEPAIGALRAAVNEEPANEEAHSGLMRLYAACGRRRAALGQYERLVEALARELSAEPGEDSRQLHEEIVAGKLPPPGGTPMGRPPDTDRHNLPAERSSFVGRKREILETKRDLAMTRLLTLTGAGGCGKTRLALAVARDLVGAYPDGAWLVELAPLSEGTLVPQATAKALGVREQPGRPLEATLADHLGDKEMLLMLDKCEHLVDAATRLADDMLSRCPRLRVLATSREALRTSGEAVRRVPSLSLPEPGEETVEGLARSEAARLFLERVRSRAPGFDLTERNARTVAQICRRLDGVLLAIELAAARAGTLSVRQIAERLDDSLGLLKGGDRTAMARHPSRSTAPGGPFCPTRVRVLENAHHRGPQAVRAAGDNGLLARVLVHALLLISR